MSIDYKAVNYAYGAWIECALYGTDMDRALHEIADSLAIYHADNLDVWSERGDHADLDMADCADIGAALACNAYLHWTDALHAAASDLPDPDLGELTLDDWEALPVEIRDDSDMIRRYLPIALATAARECVEGALGAGCEVDPEGEIPAGDWDYIGECVERVTPSHLLTPREIEKTWRAAAREFAADRDGD